MASKKTGRLAGLAALAGAAYLADKKGMFGGKGKDAKADRDDADRYTGSRAPAAEEGESAQSKFRKEELKAGDVAAMAPSKVAPVKTATAAPKAAAAAPAKSGSRGPISGDAFDNERTGGDARRGRGKSMDELHSSYGARSGDAKLRDATFVDGNVEEQFSNNALRRFGAETRERPDETPKPKPKSGMGSTITNRPDPRAPSIYAGEEAWAKYRELQKEDKGMKRGGAVKKMASGGMTSSASKRADGIATKGKTRGKMC